MGVGVQMHGAQWDAAYSSQVTEKPLTDLHKSTGELTRCHLWVINCAQWHHWKNLCVPLASFTVTPQAYSEIVPFHPIGYPVKSLDVYWSYLMRKGRPSWIEWNKNIKHIIYTPFIYSLVWGGKDIRDSSSFTFHC